MNGFLCFLKPPGMTSSQAVVAVRKLLGKEKVGHAGTLDPQACGILPLMVGRGARLFDYLTEKEKTYIAELAFGCETDTQDATGKVTLRGDAYPNRAAIEQALVELTGDIMQTPPMFSAISRNGERMYDLARKGETVDIPARPITVYELRLLGDELPNHGYRLLVRCGRGTYVRTICRDIGEKCGCPAHMRFLLRAKSGIFSLENAHTLEELQQAANEGRLQELLLPLDAPLGHIPAVEVPARLRFPALHGAKLDAAKFPAHIPENVPLRLYDRGTFLGIVQKADGIVSYRAMLYEGD